MKKYIAFVLITSLSFLYLVSCDGGGVNGKEELNVYDVLIKIEGVEGQFTDCPESTNLKLSMQVNENNISGFAELIEFGNIGGPIDVSGSIQDSNFSLKPFSIGVMGEPPPGDIPRPSYLNLNFAIFEGTFINDDAEMSRLKIEGIVSGDISFSVTGGPDCIASFTGEFTGEARNPVGCVSRLEIPTLECPAEGFINQCQQYDSYFCPGWCSDLICVDFLFNASECEIIDCVTLSCPQVGTIHLEEDGGFIFSSGDHILQCG